MTSNYVSLQLRSHAVLGLVYYRMFSHRIDHIVRIVVRCAGGISETFPFVQVLHCRAGTHRKPLLECPSASCFHRRWTRPLGTSGTRKTFLLNNSQPNNSEWDRVPIQTHWHSVHRGAPMSEILDGVDSEAKAGVRGWQKSLCPPRGSCRFGYFRLAGQPACLPLYFHYSLVVRRKREHITNTWTDTAYQHENFIFFKTSISLSLSLSRCHDMNHRSWTSSKLRTKRGSTER